MSKNGMRLLKKIVQENNCCLILNSTDAIKKQKKKISHQTLANLIGYYHIFQYSLNKYFSLLYN